MKKEEIIKMYEMRLNGDTLQEIGDKFGISRQAVFQKIGGFTKHDNAKDKIVFSGIRKWMIENDCSVSKLACSLPDISYNHIRNSLKGNTKPSYEFILAILKITGLKFEEAFARE